MTTALHSASSSSSSASACALGKSGHGGRWTPVLPFIASASLLIADVMMPEMDGIALTKALRAAGPAYPILIVSADRRREAEAMAAGATAFISKVELFKGELRP